MWIVDGASTSDESLWPTVVQDVLEVSLEEARVAVAAAAADAAAAREEVAAIGSEFSRYKARAHTALKKATSSGAEDKRKDEVYRKCVLIISGIGISIGNSIGRFNQQNVQS